ncbi:hypothetical protein [Thorsellia anophelis]|uniref:Glycosyltransferase RgtA/B/C/D-like domain-containing protein n=1 Tax=Thorsellia anophelis DSM 18579 TaxID=1123402 RepID=A0A1I0FY84_9GAMM|nr:hypothetical protein [Thorsellia anophelis]SET63228.1 hypothetical protein SAMN02583745_02931 [Thorsellia anophelis DSM 18579]
MFFNKFFFYEKFKIERPNQFFYWVLCIIFFIFIIFSLRYQYLLLDYREWGDESETIITVKMMAAGMKLYSEIFNHHGPLTFMPGLLLENFDSFGISGHRVIIAFFQVLAVVFIYTSPILKSRVPKILASVTAITVILVFMPKMHGHMYAYQTLAGIMLLIILAQYTLPAILLDNELKPSVIFLGTLLISSLPFLAITYIPISILIFLASFRKKNINYIFFGVSLGLIVNLFFLYVYGSFHGFAAFHIYLNTKILPFYIYNEPLSLFHLVLKATQVLIFDRGHLISFIAILLSFFYASLEKRQLWRIALLIIALCSLLIRGKGFHGMPYFYAIIPILVLNFNLIEYKYVYVRYVIFFFLLSCLTKVSLIIPKDLQKILSSPIPVETEFSKLVNQFTSPDDRIIAYSFQNHEYLASERLPASGYFFYLPWQEKYNENPKFGIAINACDQIKKVAPKIMLIDKWMVWDKFPWESYAGCIDRFLESAYYKLPNKPYYIRKDLLVDSDEYFTPHLINRELIR